MNAHRAWKGAALASVIALAGISTGCSDSSPSPSASASAVVAPTPPPAQAKKGKKARDPKLELGFAELREQRRRARESGGSGDAF